MRPPMTLVPTILTDTDKMICALEREPDSLNRRYGQRYAVMPLGEGPPVGPPFLWF